MPMKALDFTCFHDSTPYHGTQVLFLQAIIPGMFWSCVVRLSALRVVIIPIPAPFKHIAVYVVQVPRAHCQTASNKPWVSSSQMNQKEPPLFLIQQPISHLQFCTFKLFYKYWGFRLAN